LEDFAIQDEWQAHPRLGTVLTTSAAVTYSSAGYFTRLIELDIPTVLFWRGLYAGLFMSVCIVLLHGKETVASVRNIRLPELLAAILSAAATVCCLNALQLSPSHDDQCHKSIHPRVNIIPFKDCRAANPRA
jgi:hypothetical protein